MMKLMRRAMELNLKLISRDARWEILYLLNVNGCAYDQLIIIRVNISAESGFTFAREEGTKDRP